VRKLTELEKIQFARYSRRRGRKEALRAVRREQRRDEREADRRELLAFTVAHQLPMPRDRDRVPILLPTDLSLRTNYDATVKAIEAIRETVLSQNKPVILYF
jgi:hypothetical protein